MSEDERDPIKRFTLLVLLQAQEDRASELIIDCLPEITPRIRYKVLGTWYELSPPPLHIMPGVLREIANMAGLQGEAFPAEGTIDVPLSGTHLRWKVQLSNTDARCVPIPPENTLGQPPWS
jgi:hypothetical protein